MSIILFIEAETVDSGIKTTEFLRFFFLQRKTFENKKVKGETQDEKRVKNKKKHAHKTKGVQIDLNI